MGWQKWLISEMERSLGVSGLNNDLLLFNSSFLDELLDSEKLHKLLHEKLAKEHRPSLPKFSLVMASITAKNILKLRALQPGFYPRLDTVRKVRRQLVRDFLAEWAEGAYEMAPYYTRQSVEEEMASRAAAQAAGDEAEAVASAAARAAAAIEVEAAAAADVVLPPAQQQRLDDPGGKCYVCCLTYTTTTLTTTTLCLYQRWRKSTPTWRKSAGMMMQTIRTLSRATASC